MLPAHLLRAMTAQRRTETVDPHDGSVTASWSTVEFTGRIARGTSSETGGDGRQASVTRHKLLTDYGGLRTEDQVGDPLDPGEAWQLDGDAWPVYGATGVHHWEANLRRVDG